MAKMEQASKLAQMGFINGARALLSGLIKDSRTAGVKEKALYWIGRARLEEVHNYVAIRPLSSLS